MQENKALTGTLQILEDETSGSRVVFGEVVEALNHRGFGPLLMAPALLTILPTGAIPGIPILSAVFIFLIAGQIVAGRRYPWLPRRLTEFSFEREKLLSAIERAKPYTKTIDRFVRPRLGFFSRKIFHSIIAAICCVLALGMAAVGFIPFVPALICLPILFFALGISAKDGALILVGFIFTLGATLLILWMAGIIGSGKDQIKIGKMIFAEQPSYSINLDDFNL